MTERDWLAGTDPKPMVLFLQGKKGRDRKLRLFAVACVRRVDHLLIEKRSQEAVALAEEFAEGRASKTDLTAKRMQLNQGVQGGGTAKFLTQARRAAQAAGWTEPKGGPIAQAWTWAWSASRELLRVDPVQAALETAVPAECAAANHILTSLRDIKGLKAARSNERAVQATLLRCVFGPLPFRPVSLDPSWRTPTVVNLAQEIYDKRAFDRLPALGEVLEQAGCHDPDILSHCRGPGPHLRGCWPVDLILGKE